MLERVPWALLDRHPHVPSSKVFLVEEQELWDAQACCEGLRAYWMK